MPVVVAAALGAPPSIVAAGGAFAARRSRAAQRLRGCRAAASSSSSGDGKQGASSSSNNEVVVSPEELIRRQYKTNETEDFGDSILGGGIVEGSKEEMRDLVPFGANNLTVLRATKQYAEAFEAGKDPSEVIASALGKGKKSIVDSLHAYFSFVSFFVVLAASFPSLVVASRASPSTRSRRTASTTRWPSARACPRRATRRRQNPGFSVP